MKLVAGLLGVVRRASGRQMNEAVGSDGFQSESVIFKCPGVGLVQLRSHLQSVSLSTPSFE